MKHRSRIGRLWRIVICIAPEAEDPMSELLHEIVRQPVSSYTDVETHKTWVSAYLSTRPDWQALRPALQDALARLRASGLEPGRGRIRLEQIKPEKWADSWKRHFKPIAVNHRLLVKPSWSRRRPRRGQAVLTLDPGLSFGTGQHPTTLYCLRQLASRLRAGQSVLDIGTGSGILAIAASLLGARAVEAFDFDPDAVRIARENAQRNKVGRRLKIYRGDLTRVALRPARQFDFVCANLISTLLIAQRQRIATRVKPGGILLIAGVLKKEFAEVTAAFRNIEFKCLERESGGEWFSGAFQRRPVCD